MTEAKRPDWWIPPGTAATCPGCAAATGASCGYARQ